MKQPYIFNLNGNDSIQERKLINGNSTNLIELNNIKYKWAINLYEQMQEMFWIATKADLSTEGLLYDKLTNDEKIAFKRTLSFLIFLDSIQVANLPNINLHITSPEVKLVLTEHCSQEAKHSKTYQYTLESVLPKEERDEVYHLWQHDLLLNKRVNYISFIYQDYIENSDNEVKFYKVLIANYILEGLYFYISFNFFFSLGANSKLNGVVTQIQWIRNDEEVHVTLFQRIINELGIIKDSKIVNDLVIPMFKEAVENEIEWSVYNLKNILGFNKTAIEMYVKNKANNLLMKIGLEKLYPGFDENPYHYLEMKKSDEKANYFETTVTNYVLAESIGGWNEVKEMEIDLANL